MLEEVVYVLGTPGSSTVKIGRTTNLKKRVGDIQRMSPVPLTVLWTTAGGHELEVQLHRHFADLRSHGEWFVFADRDPVKEISAAVAAAPWGQSRLVPRTREAARAASSRLPEEQFSLMLAKAKALMGCAVDTTRIEAAIAQRVSEIERLASGVDRFEEARALRADLSEADRGFMEIERDTVRQLKSKGLSWRQVGQLLGVTGARAEQIAKAA